MSSRRAVSTARSPEEDKGSKRMGVSMQNCQSQAAVRNCSWRPNKWMQDKVLKPYCNMLLLDEVSACHATASVC